jgi:hypothetical protein
MNSSINSIILFFVLVVVGGAVKAQTPTYIFPGGTSNNSWPFNAGSTGSNKVQWVYLPSEFTPTLQAGIITHVYFRTNTAAASRTFNDLRISIRHTNITTFPNSTYLTGLTVCYGPTTTTINVPSSGWFGVQLTTPFVYDGTSNLIIEATSNNANSVTVAQATTGGNKRIYGNVNNATGTAGTGYSACGLEIVTCSTAINQQPAPITICEDEQATFSITSTDASVFKWQVDEGTGFFDVTNGPTYAGATTQTLTVNNTPATYDNYQYRCLIAKGSSTSCVDTSDTVKLNVYGLVKADPFKANDTTCIGATKDLEIKATGATVNYRWQVYNSLTQAFEDIMGQPPYILMGDVLRIAGVSDTLDGIRYRCLVDGICDTLTSNETRLTVLTIPKVSIHPADVTTDQGKDVMFEVQATGAAAKYRWQAATGNDSFAFINDGGIYSGVKTNRLRVFGVSRIQDGFQFRCEVRTSSSCNAPGDTSNFGVLYVNPPASVNGLAATDEIIVFPNPVGNELYIKTTFSQSNIGLKYKVVDKTGKTLLVGNLDAGAETKVDVSKLAADIYLLEILDASGKGLGTSRFTRL